MVQCFVDGGSYLQTISFETLENMILIEASDWDGTKEYKYVVKEIPHDQVVVRTNHGQWIPDAGYQRKPGNSSETLSRISSET